jgi:competence protein ComEC
VTVGRPTTVRVRIARGPLRADLIVAVLTATGMPTVGEAPTARRLAGRVRAEFAAAARRCCPPISRDAARPGAG